MLYISLTEHIFKDKSMYMEGNYLSLIVSLLV